MDCLAVIEGSRVASTLRAVERSLKEADVSLAGLRVSGGLGGRAYYVVFGAQHDVEAAIEAGKAILEEARQLKKVEIIPRPHPEMVTWLLRPPPFAVAREG
jgi:microcompartment protein CcmL/EutN